MGNKLCKKKTDTVDNPKAPTPFDRIINRLHLRPKSWKSDSHLNQKQVNRYDVNPKNKADVPNNIITTKPLSKSSDWTEVDLEVPEKEDAIHLRNPKLSLIFNHNDGTPTPPPRKHKKGLREKLEAVAKSGLQAFQSKKPVEEPLFTKKTINYSCPLCDNDGTHHNRDHKHNHKHQQNVDDKKEEKLNSNDKTIEKQNNKELKRKKNLSVVSLPNYNDLKLTVAHFDDIDKKPENSVHSSVTSLPNESKKLTTASTGRLDNYITRCRSFGSLLPQQLLEKLRTPKASADVESDDSFGGLEDWDLRVIEHYSPKDASLPRPRKYERDSKEVLSDIESLIVKDEDVEKPRPPVRRSESLVKKLNREAAESARKRCTEMLNKPDDVRNIADISPPPSPKSDKENKVTPLVPIHFPTEENGHVEHSSLMKILEEFSIRDKQNNNMALEKETFPDLMNKNTFEIDDNSTKNNSNYSSLTPSLKEFEKNINAIEDFINTEKNSNNDVNFIKYNNSGIVKI